MGAREPNCLGTFRAPVGWCTSSCTCRGQLPCRKTGWTWQR
uniref:Uncharacterized protein n=1 Tax=Arundo donax TaxID=35708 RepID=A0A0A8YRR2_ARUDO